MIKITWKTEKRKVKELIPASYNPRKISEKDKADLAESIKEFNEVEPVVINTNNHLIGGHQRLGIYADLGREEIDVRVPSRKLTDAEEKNLNLRLNKNTGEWDWDKLGKFDENLLKNVGFGESQLDEIFGLDMADDFNEQKEMDKAVKNPRGCRTGDLWRLGDHRLIIGDSTVKKNWERLLGEERFDLMFTDPPYRLAYCKKRTRKVHTKDGWKLKRHNMVGSTDKTGAVKGGFGMGGKRTYEGITERGVPEFDEWLSIANEYQNPKGANVMIFESWKNTRDLWNAIEKYWKIMNMIIWHVPNRMQGFSAKNHFFNKFDIAPLAGDGVQNEENEIEFEEYLKEKGQKLLDSNEVALYGQKGKGNFDSGIKHSRYWKINDHITWTTASASSTGQNVVFGAKPIQILVPYLKVLSPRGGVIVEPFGGSGSTIIASEIMKRKCRAIEISPTYAEVILNRFEKFTGIEPIKIK